METFSALLAYVGNSPVTSEFSSQRSVTRSFDVFFDLRLNKRFSKQPRRRWFGTPSRSLWRHCNAYDFCMYVCSYCRIKISLRYAGGCSQFSVFHDDVIKWKHFPPKWPFVRGIHRSPVNSPHKGQWRGAFMFSLICAWINDWVNNREAGDLRRNRIRYDVIVMPVRFQFGC